MRNHKSLLQTLGEFRSQGPKSEGHQKAPNKAIEQYRHAASSIYKKPNRRKARKVNDGGI